MSDDETARDETTRRDCQELKDLLREILTEEPSLLRPTRTEPSGNFNSVPAIKFVGYIDKKGAVTSG